MKTLSLSTGLIIAVLSLPYLITINQALYTAILVMLLISVPIIIAETNSSVIIVLCAIGLAGLLQWISPNSLYANSLNNGLVFAYLFAFVLGVWLGRKTLGIPVKIKGALAISHSLAHDIKTPTSAIKLYNDELKNITHPNKTSNETLKKSVAVIDRQVDNIATTVEFLLANASAASGEKIAQLQRISMYQCIQQAIDTYPYQSEINAEHIHWEKTNDFYFKGEKMLMRNVLFNLMKNSIHAILEKGEGGIKIYNTQDTKYNQLFFYDTGNGARKNNLRHLFTGFFGTDSLGSGLGLFYCRNIMASFGGDIKIRSKQGDYFSVVMRFPKSDKHENKAAIESKRNFN